MHTLSNVDLYILGYSVREEIPLPDKPPFTVHLGNLSFDATIEHVKDFFADCDCISVRIIEDKLEMKPKGFGYAEFSTREGIIKALALGGSQFQGRNIRISVADPRELVHGSFTCSGTNSVVCTAKDRDRPDAREFGDWSRKGPLPDLPGRTVDRRVSDKGFVSGRTFGETGSEIGERKERRDTFLQDDGKIRDLGNWERRGPLSPLPQPERQTGFRDGGRPRTNDGPRVDGFRDRKSSPAAWGDGRLQGPQDGSRPPRREFQERPVAERPLTAAEQDNQWRAKMKPDLPMKPRTPSRDGSEVPSSLAPPAPAGGRPKLNLTKRTVSETVDHISPTPISGDVKSSPFGGARPIDTATKEKKIEEKRLAAAREKKEAEEKARDEKRLAKEVAKAEKNLPIADTEKENGGTNSDGSRKVEILQRHEGDESRDSEMHEREDQNGSITDEKIAQPKEIARDVRPKVVETGGWRRHNGGHKSQRGNDPPRGQRGDGPPKGPRNDNARIPRANGDVPLPQVQAPQVVQETVTAEEDGWSTVSKPKKNQRGNQIARALPS